MIAKVIVDVPAQQTDRLFDYRIPPEWEEVVKPGMRVVVPFGPRTIQGFVIEIAESSSHNKLKKISNILDVIPVLTQELLELGEWLTDKTLSFKISAYHVMLPAALRAKVKKEVVLKGDPASFDMALQAAFGKSDRLNWDVLTKEHASLVRLVQTYIQEGVLDLEYVVVDKGNKKTERVLRLAAEGESEEELLRHLSARAAKQREVISFLYNQKNPIKTNELLSILETTRATITPLLKKGLLNETEEEVYRDPTEGLDIQETKPLELTEKQAAVIAPILKSLESEVHEPFLLHGVTGSGKTEIYLQAIDRTLKDGKEAIVLVPEIALTPQMVNRFKGRFGSKVAVLHSGLSMGEKYDEWRKIHRDEVKVVVGARSAIFAPFKNLGIIIIDEEHESSYKQEENPRYHARDVAMFRGRYHQCPVILGSATPSLESYARAKKGRYTLLPLTERVNNRAMPEVNVVDMREELRAGNRSMFSAALLEKMQERMDRNEQTVLFLNRRGYSTFVMCRDCGYVATCDHCDISLTYHRSQNQLKCHYCGHEEAMPTVCESCGSEHIRFFGTGTQKVEEEIARVLPSARVIRMDVDTTRKKGSHERLLTSFGKGEADILLGTQMIAKGLDFPNITLVGVLAADSMLHIPDFRASERTFQLMEQVSGRAGRHELSGEVVIQTYTPEHYSIELVKSHNYEAYFEMEMAQRKHAGYPPYFYLTLINVSHPEITKVIGVTEKITSFLKRELSDETVVLGPTASPIARIKDRYRYQCMIKYKNEPKLVNTLREIQQHYLKEMNQGQLNISIDLHPYLFM
ncbi:primosomal protein N' [Alkalihalophilus pseudofirmus]|uniref:primosomal protein N' n=1 Tax=Alkalihalophilus pseudofirmus TaxID=79885 RepID=UPI00259BDD2B|nr:primosomal protein N' [Alkalihalophilus pseudofirmus]WEG15671.1 primosomal protein N' [Alkalihalophilus pseudofirmus]